MVTGIACRLRMALRDERGIETLEWVLIGGLMVGVGIALYQGVLQPGLSGVIANVVGTLTGAA